MTALSTIPTIQVFVNVQDDILAAPNELNDVEIDGYVISMETHMGRQHELDRTEAGSLTLTVDNRNGMFTPWNTGSPLWGEDGAGMVPGKTVKVIAVWGESAYNLFYGYTEKWQPGPTDPVNDVATITATDILKLLALAPISSTTLYPAQVLSHDPVLYCRMGDPLGSTSAADSSGHARPLLCSGVVSFGQQDVTGSAAASLLTANYSGGGSGAILYDPTNAAATNIDCILYNENTGMSVTALWGFECFMCGSDSAGFALMVGFTEVDFGGGEALVLYVDPTTGQLHAYYAGSLGTGGPVVTDGSWHQVAAYLDSSHNLNVYVDNDFAFSCAAGSTSAPTSLYVGTAYSEPGAGWSSDAGVVLQDVALFNTATAPFGPTQIAADYEVAHYLATEEYSGERINKVLTIIGMIGGSYDYPTDIATGLVNCQGETTSQTSAFALDYILNCSATELGYFYQGNDRTLIFRDQEYPGTNSTSNTPQAYLTDNITVLGSEGTPRVYYLLQGLQIVQDDLDLWNDIQVQAQQNSGAGSMQEVTNATSILWYGRRILQRTGLLFASDADANTQAVILMDRYETPQPRVPAITVGAESNGGAGVPTMLGRQLWDEMAVSRGGPGVTVGDGMVAVRMLVESISHRYEADPGTFRTTWALSPFEVGEV